MAELIVDLAQPPERRWRLDPDLCAQARELAAVYRQDLGLAPDVATFVVAAGAASCSREHWAELEGLARHLELPLGDVALCNLYYDVLKVVLGCTAFAVEQPDGILHARNLDWWTHEGLLSRSTLVTRFVGAPAGEFISIGWPGFTGVLSGMAPGRFAVTLNSVLSFDQPQQATPVVYRLRTALEQARSFDEALAMLTDAPIPCDCLLLLTGTRAGELAVIERTPNRSAVRRGSDGIVTVTNDYLLLQAAAGTMASPIAATSCSRRERIGQLLQQSRPRDAAACLRLLGDDEVRMDMTAQQMVFHAASGRHWLSLPP